MMRASLTAMRAVVIIVTTAAHTSMATSTTVTGCGALTRCFDDPQCSQCLEAISATDGFQRTLAAYNSLGETEVRALNIGFFQTLRSTVSCSTNATPADTLLPALQALNGVIPCINAQGMAVSLCLTFEYACFVDDNCRQCITKVYTADGHEGAKTAAFRSAACNNTNNALLNNLTYACAGFPSCTFYKEQCASSPDCTQCLATLRSGDGAGAAQQCSPGMQTAVDFVVAFCFDSNVVACDFWLHRCNDEVNCSACYVGMGNEVSVHTVAADWSSLACQSAMSAEFLVHYLTSMTTVCPDVSACRVAVAGCINIYGDVCITCLNGSATSSQTPFCAGLSQEFSYGSVCQPCPASVHAINAVAFATAGVGGVSAAACIAVSATIVAHGRDRVSMRDRIIVGLMLANAVYSTANTIPLNALRTGVLDCGRMAMSFDAKTFGRAWWFCGKYGLVGFELFVLGASIRAMLYGASSVRPRVEAILHVACCAMAILAFAVFYVLCADINADGYNETTENELYTNSYNHAGANDDLDDDQPSAASLEFQRGRDEYIDLLRNMLIAWDVFAGLAIGLWAVLRILHRHALQTLRTEAATAEQAEANDEWFDTRRSAWKARRRLLEARREAFNEVAKPLEPYIAVFVLFATPAFVMSTSYCQSHSGASAGESAGTVGGSGVTTDLTYGTCDVWCEFILAFRSLSTVAVYLISRERRAEVLAVRTTWRKLCTRVVECVRCRPTPYELLDYNRVEWQEMHELMLNPSDDPDTDAMAPIAAVASMHIDECDIQKVRILGRGAFGEVWEALLQPDGRKVAVKVMLGAGAVDDDGDVIDPYADEDFRKECDALQRIDSPHLLKFLGFGTTAAGGRFIVTELLAGGSLYDTLRNPQCDLPWRTRVKIAMQVALGMKHLHERHMLHRDLKSANVLLDEQLRAKVCDFGLSRVVRPTRQRVVHSPFTGVTRLLPAQFNSAEINDKQQHVLSLEDIAVNVLDARGTMTKAAGTLLWMAPEVYRGDRNYTGAVDVYSYGIMMWELATRKKPWVDELSDGTAFFRQLNRALQTGRRPAIPDDVAAEHGEFVAVMQRCWASDPADRPSFAEVSTELFFFLFKKQ
jgi:serine/threonine protein kinase